GKKFDLIVFDACLMSMLEVANIIKNYAHVMTGSQEVELGTGLDYGKVLEPFLFDAPDAKKFGTQLVQVYEKTYGKITNDFTHSALQLDSIDAIEINTDQIAQLLLQGLRIQKGDAVKNAIRASRNKLVCTHFDEPSYIDMHHFYRNLLANSKILAFTNEQEGLNIKNQLIKALEAGLKLIENAVIANVTGKNLSQARGLSIYFPEHRIHSSYRKTNFANNNHWVTFLTQYLLA
ncbi:MAG: clostripain-related cysteine peptidase, partial [Hydrogenophaga sp.]|nr:clostripain-related cysteine peptidase [Hydrogenophaga sp.]